MMFSKLQTYRDGDRSEVSVGRCGILRGCFILIVVFAAGESSLVAQRDAASRTTSDRVSNSESTQNDSKQLEAYLSSLKLDRLVVEHLENEVGNELDRGKRLNLARRLADLYADELLNAHLDSELSGQWVKKTQALIRIYPELENSRLTIAILQSRYLVQERSFRQWWNAVPRKSHDELKTRWRELHIELVEFNQKMEGRYQELVTTVQANSGDVVASKELVTTEALLLHSSFLVGWTSYFRGVLETEQRGQWLRLSDQHFRNFLQLDEAPSLTEFSAKWFDFNAAWQVRAVVGLAMAHRGMGHAKQSEHCFQLLQENGDAMTLGQLFVWKLNSRLFLGETDELLVCLSEFQNFSGLKTTAKVNFWATTLQASQSLHADSPVVAARLQNEALSGLTRTKQAPAIAKYVADQKLEFAEDFHGNWIRGFLYFYQAVNGRTSFGQAKFEDSDPDKTDLESAKFYLTQATRQAGAGVRESDLIQCQMLLGKVLFREREFEQAAVMFHKVAAAVSSQNQRVPEERKLAAESLWLAAQSLIEVSRVDSRKSELAYQAVEGLLRRYPESSFAQRAEFEKLRLNISTLPGDEAIRRLEKFETHHPNYSFAIEESARARFRLWLTSFEAGNSDRKKRLQDLVDSELACRQLEGLSEEKKLKATLLVIDALLRYDPIDEAKIRDYFSVTSRQIDQVRNSRSSIKVEHRYYEFLFAQRIRDLADARRLAEWLVANGKDTRFERSALIYLGKSLEAEYSRAESPSEELATQVLLTFRRIVKVLGSSSSELKRSSNAQVAVAKLAELELAIGDSVEARRLYQVLVGEFPSQQKYIHGLARSTMAAGDVEAALPFWRKLNSGVQAGSDLWYESKYQLIVGLASSDPDAAGKIYRQTRRLSPELPQKWRLPFEQLEEKLGKSTAGRID